MIVITEEGVVLLVSNIWRLGMLLNILHTHESIATTKREPAPNSSGVEVEKSVLSHFTDKETMLQVPR